MNIRAFFTSLTIFLAIDFVWLGFVARSLYQQQIGHLLASKPNFIAALIFYILFVLALNYFVIIPHISHQDMAKTMVAAAIFGFITYATYDLTNLATLKDWPIMITLIDLVWGTFIATFTTFLTIRFL